MYHLICLKDIDFFSQNAIHFNILSLLKLITGPFYCRYFTVCQLCKHHGKAVGSQFHSSENAFNLEKSRILPFGED